MNSEKKIKGLSWTVLFLAVMNVTMLVTIFYHLYQTKQAEEFAAKQVNGIEADAEKFSGRYFRDQLNLDPAQMETFRNVNRVFRQDARSILVQLTEKRKQMLDEMSKPQSDTLLLNRLSDEIGQLHRSLKQVTFRYYLGIKQECNPKQQAKLHQLFQEIFINDLPLNYPGNRGPRGGGPHGNRFSR
ncbi:MAG: Spy/CpxP family protein refolding chaperone [Microbacter sp.]